MPRHPEEVTRWILKVQNAIPQLMNIPNGGAAAAQDDEYSQRSGYQDACPADQDVRGDPAVNSTLDYDAYSVVR